MSKTNNIPYLPAASIHWFHEEQADERANSLGNRFGDFTESFAVDGWDEGQGVVRGWKLSKSEQDKAITDRKSYVDDLEASSEEITLFHRDGNPVKVTKREIGAYARAMWTNDKDEWEPPTHGGNCCYRRGYELPASVMARRQYTGEPKDMLVPFVTVDYGTGKDRKHLMHLDRLKENSQKGRRGYTPLDQLANTVKLIRQGYSESAVQSALNLKRGTAQKLHALATLANKFPKLNIVARCDLARPKDSNGNIIENPSYAAGCHLPLSRIKPGTVRTLLAKASSSEKMDDVAAIAMGHREHNRLATEAEVEKAFELVIENKVHVTAMLTRDTLKTMADGCSSPKIVHLLTSIIDGDRAGLAKAIDGLV